MQKFGRWGPLVFLMLVVGLVAGAGIEGADCERRDFGFGSHVCVCNATTCGALPRIAAVDKDKVLVYTSSKAGLRFQRQELSFRKDSATGSGGQVLTVDRKTTYQKVHGFGGAFTDSAGINILSLPEAAQERLLRAYFSEDGLEYNMGRLPIGGTDFSTREYSLDDNNGVADVNLTNFSLQSDDRIYKIPLIKRAREMMPHSAGELRLFGAVWSPPKWMKTSDKYSGFGFLKKEFYQSYADYYVKFLQAYKAEGIDVYAVSTGNEPLNGVIPFKNFNALGWTPDTMKTWVRDHLGPTVRGSAFKDVKLVAHDDQRILLPWMLELVADEETAKYFDIVGYHWYLNFITPHSILDAVHHDYPDKPIINTEACNGDKPWDFTRVQLGSWERGQYYLGDIVGVMNHWTAGWIDWNLALDRQGGPCWAKNWVDSPVIVDASKGEFYLNPTYYALAHVSKFVRRDSVRVQLSSSGGGWFESKVAHIAFQRPDNGTVVVIVNKHSSEHRVSVRDEDRGQVDVDVPANSFVTVIYW